MQFLISKKYMGPFYSRLTCISTGIFLLAGCATTPNISFDKSAVGPIRTVALLRVSESNSVMVRNLSGLPALGGAIGGAIAGGAEASRNKTFVDAYNGGSTKLATLLVSDLQRELAGNGLQVSYLPDQFAKSKDGSDDYSHIQTDSDAILSVWFGPVGQIANGAIDAPYEPWVIVHVRLLNSQTKKILSQKTYTAGYKSKVDGAVFVPCATNYRFDTFAQLMADFEQSVKGLSECEKAIARQAALDLQ